MTDALALRDLGDHPLWVRMEGVSKRYGSREVLTDVDVCFRPGRVTAVLGPNGAGKTTLLKMLLGLVRPDEGRVKLGDTILTGEAEYRRDLGYMPQLPRFPENLTGRELASMLDDLRSFEGRADDSLVEAFRLEGEMEKPYRTLSGGNRQRLNAALAFRYGAAVLVLDEPTAGLDPVAARILKERIGREREMGRTILLTSHELGHLEDLADDIVFLLDGVVRFEGEVTDLLEATGETELEGAIAKLILESEGESKPAAPPQVDDDGDDGDSSAGVA